MEIRAYNGTPGLNYCRKEEERAKVKMGWEKKGALLIGLQFLF